MFCVKSCGLVSATMWSPSCHSGVLIFLAFFASSCGVLAQSCSATVPCPLNVCCSQYGFCGTTPAFCGSAVVAEPSCTGTSSNARTVGYYEGWAPSRKCDSMLLGRRRGVNILTSPRHYSRANQRLRIHSSQLWIRAHRPSIILRSPAIC